MRPPSESPIAKRAEAAKASKRRVWVRWLRELALVAAVLLAVQWWQSRGTAEGPAPALAVMGLDGPLSLSAMEGQATMVHFWATWCGVCRAEEGAIDAVAKSAPTVTVAVQSGDAAKVEAYRRERGVSFPVAVDPEGALAAQWGVTRFPTTFFIAPDGTVRAVSVGWTSRVGLHARLWWASLFRA